MRSDQRAVPFVLHVVAAALVIVAGVVMATWPLALAQPEPQAFLTAATGSVLVVFGGRRVNRLLNS